jgi:hypothetical protein
MDGFSRILEKKGGGLLCTPLYLDFNALLASRFLINANKTEGWHFYTKNHPQNV